MSTTLVPPMDRDVQVLLFFIVFSRSLMSFSCVQVSDYSVRLLLLWGLRQSGVMLRIDITE